MIGSPPPSPARLSFVGSGVGAFALVLLRFYAPAFHPNEPLYLLRGRRVVDPGFLAHDWSLGSAPWYQATSAAFDLLTSLLWRATGDALAVALTGRPLAWALAILALVRLARTLGVRPAFLLAGFAAWLASGQGFAAEEWIFGGLEQKVLAYAALFAALDAAARDRLLAAGLLAGVATAFHVLVGGWGCIALGLALGVRHRSLDAGLRFALPALVVGAPALALGVGFLGAPSSAATDPDAVVRLTVLFRNPHHLDPESFLDAVAVGRFALLSLATLWALHRITPPGSRVLLVGFAGFAGALYLLGVAARALDLFGFLRFYPFRLGDVVLPLCFWLALPQALAASLRQPERRTPRQLLAMALAAGILCWQAGGLVRDVRRDFAPGVAETAAAWSARPEDAFRQASEWIRAHTPGDAVVATLPCRTRFWLEAERAMVVAFKTTPVGPRVLDWHERLTAMNGGHPFAERGFRACRELAVNYRTLDRDQLRELRHRYGADFYLVEAERPELATAQVHTNGALFVYDLAQMR